MKAAKYLSLLGFITMVVAIIYGFIYADFGADGGTILSLTWGKVTLIDIYIMFIIFSGWIYYREEQNSKFILWFILMLIFGGATACLYLFLTFNNSQGDWIKFWTGKSSKNI